MTEPLSVGLDFDNTLVFFDGVFYQEALKQNLIDKKTPPIKKAIRDAIRRRHGNQAWTQLQALVYTEGIRQASMAEGCEEFLLWLRKRRIPFYVISHKTALSAAGGLDLRGPAIHWMDCHGFFDEHKFGLEKGVHVFFEETRQEKLSRIAACRCKYYIDDLEEVFLDPEFPEEVKAIYYCPDRILASKNLPNSFQTWKEIHSFFQSRHGV